MKEPYRKGVANHPDPESCGAVRKDRSEALTGERTGEPLSREIRQARAPTSLFEAEGNTLGDDIASRQEALRGRRPSACTDTPCTGTGRSHGLPPRDGSAERVGKAGGQTPAMHDHGKSDRPIVPKKLPNKATPPAGLAAEVVEGRGLTKGNALQTDTSRTQSRTNDVPSGLERVRQAAKRDKNARSHHSHAPPHAGTTGDRVRANQAERSSGSRWCDVGEVRGA